MTDEARSNPSPYIFGRDTKASLRLNYQHMLIKKLCNDELLHRTVQKSLDTLSSPRVADIATGTAIWLIELSDALSANCELHGFDISGDQYPPTEWLPKNVSLHEHNVLAPFGPQFLGKFDIVNLRFFITLLDKDNIIPLLKNLKTLLKPGGYLHWLDFDPRSAKAISIHPDMDMPRTESVVNVMRTAQPDLDTWMLQGSQLFEVAGLVPLDYEHIRLRNHLRPLWNDCNIMGMEELARRHSNIDDGKPSPLLLQIKSLQAEFDQGTSIDVEWFIMVGQNTV